MRMESIRLLRGDMNSDRLAAAWSVSRADVFNADVATRIVGQLSDDLPQAGKAMAAFLFVRPDAAGDVKRSTLPLGVPWSQEDRRQAKVVGNNIAGALSAHIGLSREVTAAGAGAVQLAQDLHYIINGYAAGSCAFLSCIQKTFSDHWPGSDDPSGIDQTDAGRRQYEALQRRQQVNRVLELIHGSSLEYPGQSRKDSNKVQTPSAQRIPDRWTAQGREGSDRNSPRYEYGELMSDEPWTMCVSRTGCDGP